MCHEHCRSPSAPAPASSHSIVVPDLSCTAPAPPHSQGQINGCMVTSGPLTVIDLWEYRDNIRYFSVVERDPKNLVFAARGGHGGSTPSEDAYNVQLVSMDSSSTLIVNERGFAVMRPCRTPSARCNS